MAVTGTGKAPKVRLANHVAISFLVVVDAADGQLPQKVRLRDHSLAFRDSEMLPSTVISGVYGTTSRQMLQPISSDFNTEQMRRKSGRFSFVVDAQYRVENFGDAPKSLLTEQTLDITGWLAMDRLQADYAEQMRGEWIQWIAQERGTREAARLEEAKLMDIAVAQPGFVSAMLRGRKHRLLGVVHPVRALLDPKDVLLAATVRYEPDRFQNVANRAGVEIIL